MHPRLASLTLALILTASPVLAGSQVGFGQGEATQDSLAQDDSGRAARQAHSFRRLARALGIGDSSAATEATVHFSQALQALAAVTRGFDESGRGDVDFWMKTARDFARSGRALGESIRGVARSLPRGPLAAAVSSIGAQLASLDQGGRGDVNYWMARSKTLAQRLRGAGEQLTAMAQAGTSGDSPQVATAAVLRGLAHVADSVDSGGRGDVDYWMRTTRNFCFIGRAVGRGLDRLVDDSGDPLTIVLRGIVTRFGNLSEAGRGNVDYWMARARGVDEEMRGLALSLDDIADNL